MDGMEALEILEDHSDLPDVILLDVMMPGMTGYEVKGGAGFCHLWVDVCLLEQ